MKVGFISLGCSKNQIDTEIMLKLLVDEGHEIVQEDIHAECMIVNTCAFIASAKQEAIDNILDVAWLKEHRELKGIVVCGCLAERYREEIFKELPEVDALVGVGGIKSIAAAVQSIETRANSGVEGASDGATDDPAAGKYVCFDDKEKLELGGDRVITTPEYMAYIKIAEGCDNRCSYCAIPNIRGSFRSRTIESIVEEAAMLADMGVRELNIVAQDTTRYGEDLYGELKLPALLRELEKIDGIRWIRLLYCYPERITDELIDHMAASEKIVPYIDMPIQHISDSVLARMNRKGNRASIEVVIKKLRAKVKGIVLRTTVLVGFPGETKEDFAQLCEFLKEAKFERLGAFAYSQEEDTPAADFADQVDEKARTHRADIIMRSQNKILEQFNRSRMGKVLNVLVEGFDPVSEAYYGRSSADAPEIDGKVYFAADPVIKEGDFVNVKVIEVLDFDVFGETV